MNYLDGMITALDLEVKAIRWNRRNRQYNLRNGERIRQAGGSWLYRFVFTEDVRFPDDTRLIATVNDETIRGAVVSLQEGNLIIALETDLGLYIERAQISTDETFLVQRLKERLEEVQKGTSYFNSDVAGRVIGKSGITALAAEPDSAVLSGDLLNEQQKLAVRMALGSDTTFIWGPPGTGKTKTLAHIVETHFREGRSVLLVSNTNIAVDTALEQVAENLIGEEEFNAGLVVRLGHVAKRELSDSFGRYVIPDKIAERLGKPLADEKERLTADLARITSQEQGLKSTLRDFESLERVDQNLKGQTRTRNEAVSEANRFAKETHDLKVRESGLRERIAQSESMGTLRRFLLGQSRQFLESQLDECMERIESTSRLQGEAQARGREADLLLGRLSAELAALRQRTASYSTRKSVESQLSQIESQAEPIRQRLAQIEVELSELGARILKDCRVLATTAYQAYLRNEEPRTFDIVVIDEASMLMTPTSYFVSGLAKRSVCVAGDFRQLAPIVQATGSLREEWLRKDVFTAAGIRDAVDRGQRLPWLVELHNQYRMVEPICELVNEKFYGGRLVTKRVSGSVADTFPFGNSPLLYVDTSKWAPWAAFRANTRSRYNVLHALLVSGIVKRMAEEGYLLPSEANDWVGIVSPYAAQARLIDALLQEKLGKERGTGLAATVHRFQGNEKATMILDLTDSTGVPLGGFLKATRIEEEGARLLNVAQSRAKDHVLLVGNFNYLLSKASRNSLVEQMIDRFTRNGMLINTEEFPEISVVDLSAALARLHTPLDLPDGQSRMLFNESDFYSAFRSDIEQARNSIVIYAPFMTDNGVGRWADYLRAAIERNVSVQIWTDSPSAQGHLGESRKQDLVYELRTLGVTIGYRSRMHEKVAIIDDKIVWHGSLNILSHSTTSEMMWRDRSPAEAEQLRRNLGADLPSNPPCPKCRSETTRMANRRDGRTFYKCINPGCEKTIDGRNRGT